MTKEPNKANRVPAVRQALEVLRYLAKVDEPVGVSNVAKGTGISPSSCFNLLRTMAEEDIVAFDASTKTYQLGLGLLEIASPLVNRDETALARPLLEQIAAESGALITLWRIISNERMMLIDRVYGNSHVRVEMRLGARVPILAGAIGRSVAASGKMSAADLKRNFADLRWQTPLSFDEFMADVERATVDGFGVDFDHWTRGVHAVGTIVTDRSGTPRLAIGGLSLARQLTVEELMQVGARLRDAATLLGKRLYGTG